MTSPDILIQVRIGCLPPSTGWADGFKLLETLFS